MRHVRFHGTVRRVTSVAVFLLVLTAAVPVWAGDPVCGFDHWDADSGVNLAGGDPHDGHIRYAGPCSLRVDLDDAAPGWLEHNTRQDGDLPMDETQFNVRFYVFLDGTDSGDVVLFEAYDQSAAAAITVWYQAADDILVFDLAGADGPAASAPLGTGWHSVDMAWVADAEGVFLASIDGGDDLAVLVDTEGLSLSAARLGNVMSADAAGHVYFDDYDARRFTRPGRLMVGDAAGTGAVGIGDVVAILSELNDLGFSPGQPDCNEDGQVGINDAVCVLSVLSQ